MFSVPMLVVDECGKSALVDLGALVGVLSHSTYPVHCDGHLKAENSAQSLHIIAIKCIHVYDARMMYNTDQCHAQVSSLHYVCVCVCFCGILYVNIF